MTRIKIKNENGEWETMPIIKGEPGEKGIPGEKGEKGDESYPIGTIVEYDGDTIPSGFELVEDKGEVYSTEEQRIGTWLGKPLYRKVIQGILDGTYTENGFFYSWIPYSISNFGICIDLRVQVQGIDRQYTTTGDQSSVNGVISGTAVQVGALTTRVSSGATVYIILEYTKTTD